MPNHHDGHSSKEQERSALDAPAGKSAGARELASGYEPSDISVKIVIASVIALIISVAVIQFVVVWFNDEADDYVNDEQKQQYGEDRRAHLTPPDPQLQPSPGHPYYDRDDLRVMIDQQNASLLKSGWEKKNSSASAALVLSEGRVNQFAAWLSASAATQPATAPSQPATLPSPESSTQPATQGSTPPPATTSPAGEAPATAPAAPTSESTPAPAGEKPQ